MKKRRKAVKTPRCPHCPHAPHRGVCGFEETIWKHPSGGSISVSCTCRAAKRLAKKK